MVAAINKEWYVTTCVIIQGIAAGVVTGFPAILTPVLTGNNTDIRVTKEEASWIIAATPVTGTIGYIIMPQLMQILGRRYTNMTFNLLILIGTITIALAPNLTALVAGRAIHGIAHSYKSIICLILSEYCHPKRRALGISLQMAVTQLGTILCHGSSAKLTWRQIAWMSTVPSVIGLVSTIPWPESPTWLAYKGRYKECEDAFLWLRGNDLESKKELEELIAVQREQKSVKNSNKSLLQSLKVFCTKRFLRPLYIVLTMIFFVHACGSYYLTGYTVEIMTELIGDNSHSLYFALGLDSMLFLSSLLTSAFVLKFNRRTLIFTAGISSNFLLGLTCLFDYLNKMSVFVLPLVSAMLLILYSFAASFTFSIINIIRSEIIPIEFKGFGTTTLGITYSLIGALVLKLMTNMLTSLNTYGTFSVFLLIMTGSLVVLHFILPETKDRALQNIENEFLDVKLSKIGVNSETVSLGAKYKSLKRVV